MSFSFFPRVLEKTKSQISGEIEVREQLGQLSLRVSGLIQSGGLVKTIWKKPLCWLINHGLKVKSCLVLGLGGGTVVDLVSDYWQKANITGVEIDSEIIRLGKKYFGLEESKGLKMIQADAFKVQYNKKFDLIIVDLYIGGNFPKQAETKEFFEKLKKLLTFQGVVVFNRLKLSNDLRSFEENLKNCFSEVKLVKTATNFFFVVKLTDA